MKKLLSRITIALFVTLSACYPVHAGVGDVYYCTTNDLTRFSRITGNAFIEEHEWKFKFKWTEDTVTLGKSNEPYDIVHSDIGKPIHRETFFHAVRYYPKKVKTVSFHDYLDRPTIIVSSTFFEGNNSYSLFGSCSKF